MRYVVIAMFETLVVLITRDQVGRRFDDVFNNFIFSLAGVTSFGPFELRPFDSAHFFDGETGLCLKLH